MNSISLAKQALLDAIDNNEVAIAAIVGELFANLPSDMQAEVFRVAQETLEAFPSTGWPKGMQWYDVGKRVKAMGMKSPAATALASMAAHLYANTLAYCNTPDAWANSVEIM